MSKAKRVDEKDKPVVLVSRCLGFEACRWNGISLDDPFVRQLTPFVEWRTVCPEADIGLGVPRRPVRLVRDRETDGARLIQPATGHDATAAMTDFATTFLAKLGPVDGVLLKYRSPSCGMKNVKIYQRADEGHVHRTGAGLFAAAVEAALPEVAAEDDGRLHNFLLREHWLTRVFASHRFRAVEASGKMGELVAFHSANKYLLMSSSQTALRELGRLVANHDKEPAPAVIAAYGTGLRQALARPPRLGSRINVLQHIMGYFSKRVEARERDYFLDVLEEYRREGMPLSVPVGILKAWAIRFEEEYVLQQTFLAPFPAELVTVTDSGKGRKL